MCLCICGLRFIAIQLNKTEKCKGERFLWKGEHTGPHVETMILRI